MEVLWVLVNGKAETRLSRSDEELAGWKVAVEPLMSHGNPSPLSLLILLGQTSKIIRSIDNEDKTRLLLGKPSYS